MCNGVEKHVSTGVAPRNMVGIVKLFQLPLREKFHEKVEPLPTSATVATIGLVTKTRVSPCKHHFLKLVRGAVAHKFQLKVSTCNSGF